MVMDDYVKQTYNKVSLAQLYVGTQAGFPFGMFETKPLMNQPNIWGPQPLTVVTRPQEYMNYLEWFKKSPEVVSMINCLITDILSDGWRFKGTKSARDRAEEYMLNNNGQGQLEGWLYDYFIMGNGFLFKGKMNKQRTKEMATAWLSMKERKKGTPYQNKSFMADLLTNNYHASTPADIRLQYIPAVTMNITPSDRFAN